jgi:hypothetical protein
MGENKKVSNFLLKINALQRYPEKIIPKLLVYSGKPTYFCRPFNKPGFVRDGGKTH